MGRQLACWVLACVLGLASTAGANLIGHWTLDEGTGTTVADSSGNGNNGTFVGTPVWTDGMLGGALDFDGSSSVDCGTGASLGTTGPVTVACWIKPVALSGSQGLAGRDGAYVFKAYNATLRFTTPGILDHTATNTVLEAGVWQHVAVSFQPSTANGAIFYLNGNETCRMLSSASAAGTGPFRLATNQWSEIFTGTIDDVRVYNHVLTGPEIQAAMFDKTYPFATMMSPEDGASINSKRVALKWQPGQFADSYNVYFGQDKAAVAAASGTDAAEFLTSTTATSLELGVPKTAFANLTAAGETYYWRVDAVKEGDPTSPWKGQVWSFSVWPITAWSPTPTDGVAYVGLEDNLSWQKGLNALLHTVYFGESFEEVSTTTSNGWITVEPLFDPGQLKPDTTYYWRVDAFTGTTTETGAVWSFHTRPEITVSDPNLLAWWRMDEGAGLNVTDESGHGHHGVTQGTPRWIDGYFGGALWFDGVDDAVTFGTPADLYLARNYTYNVWFKVAKNIYGNSGPQYLLAFGSRSDLLFGIEDAVGVNGDLSLHYYDTKPGFQALGAGQVVWNSDEWHMVTATKDAAVGHKIYLDGELKNSDTNTNNDNYNTGRIIALGGRVWTGNVAYFKGAMDDVRIYNRPLSESEIVSLLHGDTSLAAAPSPTTGNLVDVRDAVSLSWSEGDGAVSSDVYFSADRAAVASADKTSPAFMGNQTASTFDLAGLVQPGSDYFWRIDEVQSDGSVATGTIWTFTVPDYLIVDDFESYTANKTDGQTIYQTWIDGVENGTGSYVGYDTAEGGTTFGETGIVYTGGQSMPVDYNNVVTPYYSEISRTWTTAQDWTTGGMDTLTLYFRGRVYNGVTTFYAGLADTAGKTAFVNYPDEMGILSAQWIRWDIPLSSFTGVNPAKVKQMYLGLGNRANPTPGNAGRIFIDDIRVTNP